MLSKFTSLPTIHRNFFEVVLLLSVSLFFLNCAGEFSGPVGEDRNRNNAVDDTKTEDQNTDQNDDDNAMSSDNNGTTDHNGTTSTNGGTTTGEDPIEDHGMMNLTANGELDDSFPLAFPGAMGGGKFASGGRGGEVVVVNTRTNDCDGTNSLVSLYEALNMTGPRYIVFAVDGVIELSSCDSVPPSRMGTVYLSEQNSDVTVACQTAPGKMVIRVSALSHGNGMSNAIYRHCAFRGARVTGGETRGNQRAVGIFPNRNEDSTNFIFDHNTFSWTDDDVFQIYVAPTATANATNITVQHSIGAEGDSDSAADTSRSCNSGSGSTCKTRGQSWDAQAGGINALGQSRDGYKVENVTFTHNFLAHNSLRNCEFKGHVIAECSNNITYNWRGYGAIWQAGYNTEPTQLRGKNNLLVRGPETIDDHGGSATTCHFAPGEEACPVFVVPPIDTESGVDIANNYYQNSVGGAPSAGELLPKHPSADSGTFVANEILTPVDEPETILTLAEQGSGHMKCVGASKPVRHDADQRIIDEMYAGTGKIGIGDDVRSNSGVVNASTHDTVIQRDWSEFSTESSHSDSYDSDRDGISDEWELANGLEVGVRDHNDDLDSDGYTNIEEFLNYLARCP